MKQARTARDSLGPPPVSAAAHGIGAAVAQVRAQYNLFYMLATDLCHAPSAVRCL
jgi:hypothetical protein